MKKVLIGCGVLLLVLVAFVVLMLSYGSAEFKPLVAGVLQKLDAGKAEEVYQDASDAFRKSTSLEDFKSYVASRRCALGDFVEAGSVTGVSRNVDQSGSFAEVSLHLKFQKTETPGTFKFVSEQDAWKLLGLKIDIPGALGPDRTKLEARGRELLDLYNEGKFADLHAILAPELQAALPLDGFQSGMQALQAQNGKITDMQVATTRDDEQGYTHVDYNLTFENGTGKASFKLFWRECRWDVLGINIAPA